MIKQKHNKVLLVVFIVALFANIAFADAVLISAEDMDGIENWKKNTSWGAGYFYSTDGSSLNTTAMFKGGEYKTYVRLFTSPYTEADIHIRLGDHHLVPPMQAKVHKFGWVSLGAFVLPSGPMNIAVDPPVPGQSSNHNIAALAFVSSPLEDRVGRIMAFTEWLRHELICLEAPKPAPLTVAEAHKEQQALRRVLLDTLGLAPLPPRTPLNAQVVGRIERDGYVIEKLYYESRPNHIVPALLYLPEKTAAPVPAVISAIGHWSNGKSSPAPQRRGITFAKNGYAVLAVEGCYAWERAIPGNSEGFEPLVAGGCIAGHEVWDIMRGVDYLETRSDIDTSRLAITGASGGGLQTFYAGMVDERFDVVMPAVALWSMPELAINGFYSGDNWVPGISLLGGMGRLIPAIAPRAVLVMNVDADYSTSYACEVMVNAARPWYRMMDAESKLRHTIEKGNHDYTRQMREDSIAFLDRWLKETGSGLPEPEADIEKELFDQDDPELFVFEDGKIPEEGADTVTSIWTAEAKVLRDALPVNVPNLAGKMREMLRMPPVTAGDAKVFDEGFLLTTDPGVQVAVVRIGSGPRAVVWLGESDFATELQRPEVQQMARHATVFVVEPRGAGMSEEMHILRHAPIVMGRPLSGMWAYDLLCVVDYLALQGKFEKIRVAGRGFEMGLACLLATLLDERIEETAIDGMFASFALLVGYSNPAPQIPGILKVADVVQLVHAASVERVHMNNLVNAKQSGGIEASSLPAPEFFETWMETL